MTSIATTRRNLVNTGALAFLSAAVLSACSDNSEAKKVGAVEDLMREHGVLRRVLLVYSESALKLRSSSSSVDASALSKAAKLFHDFGEEYHERKLEEAYIFPRVRKAGGQAASYVDTLLAQHQRGRKITQYILASTGNGKIASSTAEPLANAFETFVLMYQNHTAREDTIIFPAWKNVLSDKESKEFGDKFEDIEKQQFGGDGFEDAGKQVDFIERSLGFANLSQFTAPPPPR
jgi:hemerythrin-like domain-containing protein